MEKLNTRQWAGIALGAILIAFFFLLGPQRFGWGVMRWCTILMSGALGYAVGWFFSPNARKLRRGILIGFFVLNLLIVFVDNGATG